MDVRVINAVVDGSNKVVFSDKAENLNGLIQKLKEFHREAEEHIPLTFRCQKCGDKVDFRYGIIDRKMSVVGVTPCICCR